MCTYSFYSCEAARCFLEAQNPKPCGVSYCQETSSCLTQNKFFEMRNLDVRVQVPSVEKLNCRTACCCCYIGCACGSPVQCFACRDAANLCGCCDLRDSISCLDLSEDHACCKGTYMSKCLSCDHPDESSILCESVAEFISCCCCKCERMFRGSCSSQKCSCCYARTQRCCIYSKVSLPVSDEVPCELGLCGLMCLNKSATIKTYESKNPEEVGFNQVKAVGGPISAEVEEMNESLEEVAAAADPVEMEAVPCEVMVKRSP